MNIMLVSQCSKQALPGTRRILDQFAERKGARTWLTPITEAGLQTLHMLLRKQARRNTAVSCHRIRNSRVELLWIVGNRRKFDHQGNVPTDTRSHSVLNDIREDGWKHAEGIALLASIAGLFHDFGKANDLFQAKLTGKRKERSEPVRHEWVSARLFEAFVNARPDQHWLAEMADLSASAGDQWIDRAFKDGIKAKSSNPLTRLEHPVARAVCWLIITHHRMPYSKAAGVAGGDNVDAWPRALRPDWNSPQFDDVIKNKAEYKADLAALWQFSSALPVASKTWRKRAAMQAQRALNHPEFTQYNWFDSTFCLHVARCALMLADHCYSSREAKPSWQDDHYSAWANTEKATPDKTRALKQKLDEHCIGVAHFGWLFARSIPRLRTLLPAISDVRAFRKNTTGKYSWQNKAYKLAQGSAEHSQKHGGFFVNMASTGTGKTLANARMAYALNEHNDGCRFNILLGLRTLTLQTGDALRERTNLGEAELGVLVGTSAVKELHASNREENNTGSESINDLTDSNSHMYYEGEISQSRFGEWLGNQRKKSLLELLSAPVMVSTIDYMMPATEADRGGHQIAPMLRLLSSDIVLDEPDDFGLTDQPALCRLVHWAGLLGSRVILSSATLAPALVEALFSAYLAGRKEFNGAMAKSSAEATIACGWIDESISVKAQIRDPSSFVAKHEEFVRNRHRHLLKTPPRRLAKISQLPSHQNPADALANGILNNITQLHGHHNQQCANSGKTVSIGIVRMANINPLVAVAKKLVALDSPEDTDLHICIYHARHPLKRRNEIEKNLDSLLNRSDTNALWKHPALSHALDRKASHQIFVVFATAVAEVGRDHCYDWAIVEPSSMRSIVQLAGRVMRHRPCDTPANPNILLLNKNYRALQGNSICFRRPGYESRHLKLNEHDLSSCLSLEHYQHPGPGSCIREPVQANPETSLVDLEHTAMRAALLNQPAEQWPASLWWEQPVRWCYQMQANTRFRAGQPTQLYALVTDDESTEPYFAIYVNGEWRIDETEFVRDPEPRPGPGMHWWLNQSDIELIATLAEDSERDLETACKRIMTVELPDSQNHSAHPERWLYHIALGLYREV